MLPRRGAKQRQGPMREVKRILLKSGKQFDPNLVELVCGHRVRSKSPVGHRAHCGDCLKEGRT